MGAKVSRKTRVSWALRARRMPREPRAGWRWSCALALLASASAGAQTLEPAPQQIMAEIVEALRVVLPLSLDGERFADPANRAAAERALDSLAHNAQRLEAHASGRELGFAHLSGSLARNSVEIRKRFERGRVDEARFLLQHLTETCVACHSRLPDDRNHDLGRKLTDDAAIAALPREERVQLEIATRQFERALATYESLFADPRTSIAELDLSGDLEEYLELCLRVQEDPERAIENLRKLGARKDLPKRLQPYVSAWIEALRGLEEAPARDPIARARELVAPALAERYGASQEELVQLVAASGILQRYVATTTDPAEKVGEAYYLLGVVESRVGRSFWASQTEFFLETAIRMGPKQPYARAAFDLLEEFLVSGYTGSAGTNVPADVERRLESLDDLIESARDEGSS